MWSLSDGIQPVWQLSLLAGSEVSFWWDPTSLTSVTTGRQCSLFLMGSHLWLVAVWERLQKQGTLSQHLRWQKKHTKKTHLRWQESILLNEQCHQNELPKTYFAEIWHALSLLTWSFVKLGQVAERQTGPTVAEWWSLLFVIYVKKINFFCIVFWWSVYIH